MIKREYYSLRKGIIKGTSTLDFDVFKKLFLMLYKKMDRDGYFQKYFGIFCEDGYTEGQLGDDIDSVFFINLRKENLWPIYTKIDSYIESDLFDIIEFLHDHCSTPLERFFHDWNNCGWHVQRSDDQKGQKEFREAMNSILKDYKEGFELSEKGEILALPEQGFEQLLGATIPTSEDQNVKQRIESAIIKFRRAKSTVDERRDALRDLADVLEYLRPQLKDKLTYSDEADLFNIANNFGIRHHNLKQKTNYDKPIWHSWIFYSYLSTIHLILRLIENKD